MLLVTRGSWSSSNEAPSNEAREGARFAVMDIPEASAPREAFRLPDLVVARSVGLIERRKDKDL